MVSLEEQPLVNSFNKVFLGAAGTPTGASDDEFNRVSFLSHFDGANNGVNNAFDDGSSNNHTISNTLKPTQGSFGPFAKPDGEWGVSFDGNSDYLQVPASSDFDFGTGNFTIELFFFHRKHGANYDYLATFGNAVDATTSFGIYLDGAGTEINLWNNGAITSSTSYNLNQWYHLAVVRASNTVKVYLDGSEIKSATLSTDISSPGGMNVARWGLSGDSQYFNGLISNLRVVKGTAVYTGNFTAPTSKLTAITNTKLLICQSNRFLDNSASGHTVTPYATSAITAFGPFLTSAVYDAAVNGASSQLGPTNYISIADGAWKTLGTGNFTWEWWIYPIAENVYQVGDGSSSTNVSGTFTLGISSKRLLLYYSIQGGEAYPVYSPDSAPYYNLNEWHHLAYVRSGNDHKIYANGVLRATEARSGTMVDSTAALNIGNFGPGYVAGGEGIYCDVRLVKGTAVYSGSTYTVPTAPLTAISGTELLLNFKDGQAIDSAAQNNLTLFGNAKLSTSQKKFGDTSLLLDGTGDFVHLNNRPNLTGPFCIEAWARADDTGNAFLWCLGQYRLELGINGDNLRIYRIGTATGYTSFFTSGEFSANNWHHVALVRDTSNVIKCYLNGTASGTTVTDATAFIATNNIFIIGGESSGAPSGGAIAHGWDGYVDDFRISDFARYTSNFTAPAEPFADKGQ